MLLARQLTSISHQSSLAHQHATSVDYTHTHQPMPLSPPPALSQAGDDKKLVQAASRKKKLDERLGLDKNAKGMKFKVRAEGSRAGGQGSRIRLETEGVCACSVPLTLQLQQHCRCHQHCCQQLLLVPLLPLSLHLPHSIPAPPHTHTNMPTLTGPPLYHPPPNTNTPAAQQGPGWLP